VVIHRVNRVPFEDPIHLAAPDINLIEVCVRMNVGFRTRREIVNDDDSVTLADVGIDNVRSNKPCTTGDENVHVRQPPESNLS
jgi:hypothetical protein